MTVVQEIHPLKYDVIEVTDKVVYFTNLDAGNLISNSHLEKIVCRQMAKDYPDHRFVYRTEKGVWDELVHDKGKFLDFKPYTIHVKPIREGFTESEKVLKEKYAAKA